MWKLIMDLVTGMNASKDASSINPLQVLSVVRSASSALLAQATLHAQLAQVEWEEEKQRLSSMLIFTLMGFACFLCLLFFVGAFVLTLSWDTQYRIPVFVALIFCYFLALLWAGFKLYALAQKGSDSFAGTRAEIAADIALIKRAL
jgi:uncharacterized membrane protein YqjE